MLTQARIFQLYDNAKTCVALSTLFTVKIPHPRHLRMRLIALSPATNGYANVPVASPTTVRFQNNQIHKIWLLPELS